MRIRAFVTLAFILNIVLGNICLLGSVEIASAAETPQEERMSTDIPMSPFIVECEWVKTDNGWEPSPDSACASGHCVKKSAPEPPCTNASVQEIVAATFSVPIADAFVMPVTNDVIESSPTESPPDAPMLRAVVMRQ